MIDQNTKVAACEHFNRISWGALFAGAVVAIVSQLLLSLLGLAIGLVAIIPDADVLEGIGVGSAIWWVVTATISIYIGGWMAGRLSGFARKMDGLLHGVLVWSLVTIISVMLITTTLGMIVGGAAGIVSRGAMLAGQTVETSPRSAADLVGGVVDEVKRLIPDPKSEETKKLIENTEEAAGTIATAAFWDFVAMILGLVFACLGGARGASRNIVVSHVE